MSLVNIDTSRNQEFHVANNICDKNIPCIVGRNLGNITFTFRMAYPDFCDMSEVANEQNAEIVAQRNLDNKHADKFSIYIFKSIALSVRKDYLERNEILPDVLDRILKMHGEESYCAIAGVTVNLPPSEIKEKNILINNEKTVITFRSGAILRLVDGQHRRAALKKVFQFLAMVIDARTYPKRSVLYSVPGDLNIDLKELHFWKKFRQIAISSSISVEAHYNLNIDEERQTFVTLNQHPKKAEQGLVFNFDQSNSVNMWIKNNLQDGGWFNAKIVEKDQKNWRDDQGNIVRKDLMAINALLFLNKTNVNEAKPLDAEKEKYALSFWKAINNIKHFGEAGAKQRTIAAQPVVLKALAKLSYDFAYGKHCNLQNLQKLLDGIANGTIDFSHEEKMWRYFNLSQSEREDSSLRGLSEYLPPENGANRDIGIFNNGEMRYGSRHNDIYPIIGDMIRWKLNLPKRHID